MRLRIRYSFRPFFWSELLIALYLFIFIVLTGSRFGAYATRAGLLAISLFFAEIVMNNRVHWLRKLIPPLLPFACFVLLSILLIPLLPETANRVWNNFTGFLFILIVFALYRLNGKAPWIEGAFLASTVIIGLMSVATTGGRARFEGVGEGSTGASTLSIIIGIAIFLGLKIIFSELRSRLDLRIKRRIFVVSIYTAIFLGAQFIIFASGSRQGLIWLLIACAFVGSFFFQRRLLIGMVLSIPLGMLFLAGAFVALRETTVVQRFVAILDPHTQAFDPEKSFITRTDMINRGLEMFWESPLWGNGNEAFRTHGGFFTYSHNNYIELLVNYGLIGFTLFYLPLVVATVGSLLSVLNNERPFLRISWLWCFFACSSILVSNIFIPSYYMRPMLTYLGALLGYYYFLKDHKEPFLGYHQALERVNGRMKKFRRASFHAPLMRDRH